MNIRHSERGFALPTVVITAVILMTLLVGGLSTVTSVRGTLNEQYYLSIAREAAEAGINYSRSCVDINLNSGTSTGWGFDATTLDNGDLCSGAPPSGVNCVTSPTATVNQCYVMYDTSGAPRIRSWFSSYSVAIAGSATFTLKVIGTVGLYSSTGTTPYKTYTYTQQQQIASDPHVGLATGNDTSCSIQYNKLYCWGQNDYGQVGIGTTNALNGSPPGVLRPTLVQGALTGKFVHAVATGVSHVCAVTGPQPLPSVAKFASDPTVSSKIYCWGSNATGQYGNTSWTNVTAPSDARVLNMTDHYATAISGRDFNCVIAPSNSNTAIKHTYCWGENNQNQAGRSTNCTTASNADTPDPKNAFGCAIRWNNTTNDVLETTTQLSAVTNGNVCGVLAEDGNIAWCMGNVDQGGLGNGDTSGGDVPRAVRVRINSSSVVTGVSKVATNNGRACALATYGSPAGLPKLFCWGMNWDVLEGTAIPRYQVDSRLSALRYPWATQMQTNRSDTTYVFYNKAVSDFAISDWNTCFIVAGEVYCAGYNDEGQLGVGNTNGPSGTPSVAKGMATAGSQVRSIEWAVKVQGLLTGKVVVGIVGGNNHFCVSTTEKDVYCWGSNDYGQLGDGTTTDRTSPVKANIPKNIIY